MNRRIFYFLILLVNSFCAIGQKVSISPTISPTLFKYNDQITVTFDATGTALANLTTTYIWVWIPDKNINAKYNVNPATSVADPAKFTKSVAAGKTTFSITFKPSDFFATSISVEKKLGMLIKGADWSNGQSIDHISDIWDGGFQIKVTAPTIQPLFVNNGSVINIEAVTPSASNYTLFVNDVTADTQNSITKYTYMHTVAETSGYVTVKLVANNGTSSDEESFQYIISTNSPIESKPPGIIPGINYSSDQTKVTLCLWAPGKSSVYTRGDFSNWSVLPEYMLKKDGEYFWLEISGLTAGTEYAFQYLIDENIFIADPYADKILDGNNDQYIPAASYPSLKAFPEKARSDKWYFNTVSVLQTNQPTYQWIVTNFQKPVKENLVIYELLVRDFFADGQRNYQNLIDTITYFKRLGVSAIELMPIMEFSGNDSWGYNPTFMFAPDKYYGKKDKLKEFIDVCHQNGIAVILDIAMNHQDLPNAYLMQDFNFTTFKPNPTNKWFNVEATHPFSVFFDMNHESKYTKAYLDTINYHWLNEYKVDGFRYDLSKGFTQTSNPNNVGAWGNYDASRIAILKRMADKVWQHTPQAYIILEHFAANDEEKELAEYKIGEGKGMMLWGNLNNAYAQNSMGFATSSDISGILHVSRGWSTPHIVGYMESHDEERLMFKNLQFGNTLGGYSVKTLATGLARMQAAATIFYTIPGPKMLWQFGELGYDISIDDGGRTSAKPIKWEYQNENGRKVLYRHISDLVRLRNTYAVFTNGDATFQGASTLQKQLTIKNKPYTASPANADEMNVQVVVNFDVSQKTLQVNFPHAGTWYDYYGSGESIEVSAPHSMTLAAGEYKLFTDFRIENPIITGIEDEFPRDIEVFPNPTKGILNIAVPDQSEIDGLILISMKGEKIIPRKIQLGSWDIAELSAGIYIVEIQTQNKIVRRKVIKY